MVIAVENATYTLKGVDSLVGFSAEFPPGISVVLGPVGSGRHALMALLAGQARLASGDLLVDGVSAHAEHEAYLNRLSFLPSGAPKMDGRSVEKALRQEAGQRRLNRVFADERIERVLSLLDLHGIRDKKLSSCTADEAKRTAIAQAMLPDAELLLLEEPFDGLAPDQKIRLASVLQGSPHGKVTVLSCTNPADAEPCAERVVLLSEGRCLLAMPMAELLARFAGRVWRSVVPQEEAYQIKLDSVVTHQQKVPAGLQMTVVAQWPPACALLSAPEQPSLRDAYAFFLARGVDALDTYLHR